MASPEFQVKGQVVLRARNLAKTAVLAAHADEYAAAFDTEMERAGFHKVERVIINWESNHSNGGK